jgi:hypothetical protein
MSRGSRKHVLDRVLQPNFASELCDLVAPVRLCTNDASVWMPMSHLKPEEARLERFGPRFLPNHSAWEELQRWWLAHRRGANTPNWDIALGCEIEGRSGLILVEAKANVPELGEGGKILSPKASENSRANHDQIGKAIEEARNGFADLGHQTTISRDTHYQLSNRLAFTWKLAKLGIPVVLVYLGFTGDTGIIDAGDYFVDAAHWEKTFRAYADGVGAMGLFDSQQPLNVNDVPAWFLIRAMPVIEISRRATPRLRQKPRTI